MGIAVGVLVVVGVCVIVMMLVAAGSVLTSWVLVGAGVSLDSRMPLKNEQAMAISERRKMIFLVNKVPYLCGDNNSQRNECAWLCCPANKDAQDGVQP